MKILTLSLMVAGLARAVNAGVYSIEVLPDHPTDQFTVMSSINDHGLVVRTYRYTPGLGSEELASPNPNLGYIPIGINNRVDVVGQAVTPDGYLQDDIVWRTGQNPEVLGGGFRVGYMPIFRKSNGVTGDLYAPNNFNAHGPDRGDTHDNTSRTLFGNVRPIGGGL